MPPRTKFHYDGSARFVVLICRDAFLQSRHTRDVVQALETIHGEIDRFDFDGDTVALVDVMDELRSVGLLHAHKLVIVDKADRFLASSGDSKGPSRARQVLAEYAKNTCEGATLLLRAETWNKGKLDELVDVFKVEVKDPEQAVDWCQKRCPSEYQIPIEPEAAALLVNRVGIDLGRIDGELAKLAIIAGDGSTITATHVRELVGASREEEAWEIKTAILLDGAPGGLQALQEILELSRDRKDVPAFWAIVDLLRQLHAASTLMGQGMPESQVKTVLKIFDRRGDPRPTATALLRAARRTDPRALESLLQNAMQAQVRLRTGIGEPRRALEAMTVRIAEQINVKHAG